MSNDLLDKTKASVAKKQAGIEDREEPSFLQELKDKAVSLPRRTIEAVGTALTPDRGIKPLKQVEDDTNKEVEKTGMKRGGKVKARGVGVALRGHGKGRMR